MKPHYDPRTEEILNSLDGIRPAPAPDFFYTRLQARMEKELLKKEKRPLILRPVFAIATLALILVINAAVIFQGNRDTEPAATESSLSSIAAEYSLNDIVFEEVYK